MSTTSVATIAEVRAAVAAARAAGETVALVPTMGALHEGHLSLIRAAKAECQFVVVSIFVNPTQFGPGEDLDRYPRDLERDLALCDTAGADLVFAPSVGEMYGERATTYVEVEELQDSLCGASRPGHFRGVCTVVAKLFNICLPDRAYFGQKDAQQLIIIRKMTADLNISVTVVPCPIVREPDGLALSSRNVYLSPEERRQALVLNRSLKSAVEMVRRGERDASVLARAIRDEIETASLARIDYVAIVDGVNLLPADRIAGECLIALAVKFGTTRLIDNAVVAG